MSFYIEEVLAFQLSFEPVAVVDGSPIIFQDLFHVDTTDVVAAPSPTL